MDYEPQGITIFETDAACYVDPGIFRVSLKAGGSVVIRNGSTQVVKLIFTDVELFRGVPDQLDPSATAEWTPKVPAGATLPYATEYAVLCTRSKTFAIGNSNPRIIVYP